MCWFTKSKTSTKILLSFIKDLSEVIRGVAAKLQYNFAKKIVFILELRRILLSVLSKFKYFLSIGGKISKTFLV